ncbi:hypothetical protein FACS1894211_07580 [Clostridia bacterium]|nr:hypothetical protein FACS1894211_07580 [Clostridia bacterium]
MRTKVRARMKRGITGLFLTVALIAGAAFTLPPRPFASAAVPEWSVSESVTPIVLSLDSGSNLQNPFALSASWPLDWRRSFVSDGGGGYKIAIPGPDDDKIVGSDNTVAFGTPVSIGDGQTLRLTLHAHFTSGPFSFGLQAGVLLHSAESTGRSVPYVAIPADIVQDQDIAFDLPAAEAAKLADSGDGLIHGLQLSAYGIAAGNPFYSNEEAYLSIRSAAVIGETRAMTPGVVPWEAPASDMGLSLAAGSNLQNWVLNSVWAPDVRESFAADGGGGYKIAIPGPLDDKVVASGNKILFDTPVAAEDVKTLRLTLYAHFSANPFNYQNLDGIMLQPADAIGSNTEKDRYRYFLIPGDVAQDQNVVLDVPAVRLADADGWIRGLQFSAYIRSPGHFYSGLNAYLTVRSAQVLTKGLTWTRGQNITAAPIAAALSDNAALQYPRADGVGSVVPRDFTNTASGYKMNLSYGSPIVSANTIAFSSPVGLEAAAGLSFRLYAHLSDGAPFQPADDAVRGLSLWGADKIGNESDFVKIPIQIVQDTWVDFDLTAAEAACLADADGLIRGIQFSAFVDDANALFYGCPATTGINMDGSAFIVVGSVSLLIEEDADPYASGATPINLSVGGTGTLTGVKGSVGSGIYSAAFADTGHGYRIKIDAENVTLSGNQILFAAPIDAAKVGGLSLRVYAHLSAQSPYSVQSGSFGIYLYGTDKTGAAGDAGILVAADIVQDEWVYITLTAAQAASLADADGSLRGLQLGARIEYGAGDGTGFYDGTDAFLLISAVGRFKADQPAITGIIDPNKAVGDASFDLSILGGGGTGDVTYIRVSGPATVTAAGRVTITGTGTVTVNVSKAGDDFYLPASANNLTFSIGKGVNTVAWSGEPQSKAYTGSAYVLGVTASAAHESAGISYVYSADGGVTWTASAPTAVGEYKVKATAAATANYLAAESIKDFSVLKAANTVTWSGDPQNADHTGSAYVLGVTASAAHESAAVEYLYSADGGVTWTATAPTDAGDYKVKAAAAETANYLAAESEVKSFTINVKNAGSCKNAAALSGFAVFGVFAALLLFKRRSL